MERGEIKNRAKEILEGRRGHYAIFLLVAALGCFIISFVANLIPFIGQLISIVIGIAYTLMLAMFTVNFCNSKEKVDIESTIPNFTPIWKYGVINILFIVIVVIITIPFMIMIVIPIMLDGNPTIVIIASLLIMVISAIVAMPIMFIKFIVIENEHASVGEILSLGVSLSFSNFGKIVMMYLSLIPWYLLIMVTLGIGAFYVTPYIETILYIMYKDFRGEALLTQLDKTLY